MRLPFSFAQISISLLFILVLIANQLLSNTATAGLNSGNHNDEEVYIPQVLEPWRTWVLQNHPTLNCPISHNSKDRHCAWPQALQLDVSQKEAQFEQRWTVYAKSWIPLPGDQRHWPQSVMVNNEPAPVTQRNGRPYIELEPGDRYTISGHFKWMERPQGLMLAKETGVVLLTIDGETQKQLNREANGKLWLSDPSKSNERTLQSLESNQSNTIQIKAFRRLIDDFPMRLETHLQLQIAGKERELTSGQWLPDGFVPTQFNSDIPARLEPNGDLTLLAKPGQWTLRLTARATTSPTTFKTQRQHDDWPAQEIWSFASDHRYRTVKISGASSVDPKQASVPPKWQNDPAYLLDSDNALQITVEHRGDPYPAPNQLSIKRAYWMDFSGDGFTVLDTISGTMKQGWRLSMQDAYALGRVELNGEAQPITTLNDDAGIEVRAGHINLRAISRYQTDSSLMNAVQRFDVGGWKHDFDKASSELHLPPGWSLFATANVDNNRSAWLQRWNLWKIFLVLITAVCAHKVMGWRWGVLTAVTMALCFHTNKAPIAIWLNLLAIIALLRVLPEGRFKTVINYYRHFSFICLVLIILPFFQSQLKTALYPQLERYQSQHYKGLSHDSVSVQNNAMDMVEMEMAPSPSRAERYSSPTALSKALTSASPYEGRGKNQSGLSSQFKQEMQQEQRSQVQTGPGLPTWQWHRHRLSWSGPVTQQQSMTLWLLSPGLTRLWRVLEVLLVAGLALGFAVKSYGVPRLPHMKSTIGASSAAALLVSSGLALGLLMAPSSSVAETHNDITTTNSNYPPKHLLDTLEKRLTKPPSCLPNCANITHASVMISKKGDLWIALTVDTLAFTDIPLPFFEEQLNRLVLLEGGPNSPIKNSTIKNNTEFRRDGKGQLHVPLSGPDRHQLRLYSSIDQYEELLIRFPLKPHYIEFISDDWTADGLNQHQLRGDALQLQRKAVAATKPTAEPSNQPQKPEENLSQQYKIDIPPFVHIERTLYLGQSWTVETRVRRAFSSNRSFSVNIPLIEGESVISNNINAKDSIAQVSFSANQRVVYWRSVLTPSDALTLTAKNGDWYEDWKLNADSRWHVEHSGIAPIKQVHSEAAWVPQWRPYPGESLNLSITKPEIIEGETLTIEQVRLSHRPGERSQQSTLDLSILTSQGGDYPLSLPDGAQLQSIVVNGTELPIRGETNNVKLPLKPGKQEASISWIQDLDLSSAVSTPTIDLGVAASNINVNLRAPSNRWPIWVSGPMLGPAVLYWSVLLLVLMIAAALSYAKQLPVKHYEWFLLGIGMSTSTIGGAIVIVAWFFALQKRQQISEKRLQSRFFNVKQIGLVALTFIAVSVLVSTIPAGLLWRPEMFITGNGSSQTMLQWYQDRSTGELPQGTLISLPMWCYRLFMLVWSLWLAFALMRWAKWGWQSFSTHGIWSKSTMLQDKRRVAVKAKDDSDVENVDSDVDKEEER